MPVVKIKDIKIVAKLAYATYQRYNVLIVFCTA